MTTHTQAAHGWLEQEALGDADDGQMDDNVKLAFPEWVSLLRLSHCPTAAIGCKLLPMCVM